jgi:hypothetical protein
LDQIAQQVEDIFGVVLMPYFRLGKLNGLGDVISLQANGTTNSAMQVSIVV